MMWQMQPEQQFAEVGGSQRWAHPGFPANRVTHQTTVYEDVPTPRKTAAV